MKKFEFLGKLYNSLEEIEKMAAILGLKENR